MIQNLEETIGLMTSPDYKDRFKAEYEQLCLRLNKLDAFLEKWDKHLLNEKKIFIYIKKYSKISKLSKNS